MLWVCVQNTFVLNIVESKALILRLCASMYAFKPNQI